MSVKLKSIYLKNFLGISIGLNKNELFVDFKKLKKKNIILIIGDNATGKSTFMSVLHCLPGTTDGRNKFIIEGKEGIKTTVYSRSDGSKFTCKIVYSPTSTGHSTKGFVKKVDNEGNETELNPNGNITSYKEVVADELGISDAILKLANQNDVCKGHVDMTSTERKTNMSTFLPDDIYSGYYTIVDKLYKELKLRMNILVESLGKMHDEETLSEELKIVTSKINSLVSKRDKCTAKIAEYNTKVSLIKDTHIDKREKELRNQIALSRTEMDKIASKMDNIFNANYFSQYIKRDDTLENISQVLNELAKQAKDLELDLKVLTNIQNDNKRKRNQLSKDIELKEESIKDLEIGKTVSELEELLITSKKRLNTLDALIRKANIDDKLTKDNLLVGYEIVASIRRYIDAFGDYDRSLVDAVCSDDYRDFRIEDLICTKQELTEKQNTLISKISAVEDSDIDSESVLDKRPKECDIDTCPFIATAHKLKKLQDNLPKYSEELKLVTSELSKIEAKIRKNDEMNTIKNMLSNLWQYVKSNMTIISKLPYSDRYRTLEALKLSVISRGKNLSDADSFDDFIEVLEYKEEFENLSISTIPQLIMEIETLKTKGSFIKMTKDDLARLTSERDGIISSIEATDKKIDKVTDDISAIDDLMTALGNFYEYKSEYGSIYKEIINADAELKSIADKIDELNTYLDKVAKKKADLRDIEEELAPLTRTRELYKMEQLKIADYKAEKEIIDSDLFKCSLIRDALSVKGDGIPVTALGYFMDTVRQNANTLLSGAFNGNLYLEEFVINSKDFIIPYRKNGDRGMDVSYSSSSERSFISLCLTLAIIEEIVTGYTVVCLDEVDRGFAANAKSKFIEILAAQIQRSGIQQLFMITHNASFYEGYDVGFIAFPGAEISAVDEDDLITIERG